MIKIFIIKDKYRKKLGKVIFSDEKFEVKISSTEDRKQIEKLIKNSLKKGISTLGMSEIILKKPLKLKDALFFDALEDLLIKRGYIIIKEKII